MKYFKDTLEGLGDYYTIELQEYTTEVTLASATAFSADGVDLVTSSFSFGNNGTWTDVPLANVANLGCDPVSYNGDHPMCSINLFSALKQEKMA